MGFMRKALFLGTGGMSGLAGVRANSKKERTAKATEKQTRLMKQQLQATGQSTAIWTVSCPYCHRKVQAHIGENIGCPYCGNHMDVVRPGIRTRAIKHSTPTPAPSARVTSSGPSPSAISDLERLVALHEQGALSDTEFAAAKAKLLGA